MPATNAADAATLKASGHSAPTIQKVGYKSVTAAQATTLLGSLQAIPTVAALSTAQQSELLGQIMDLLPRANVT